MNSRSAASIAPRLIAAAALGTAITLGATGCTFITPQETTNIVNIADGVDVASTGGPVVVRNALIVATDDGSAGNLVAALVNDGDKSASLTVDVEGRQLNVRVPAGETVSLGAGEDPLLIEGLGVKPGATVEVLFRSGDESADPIQVPVLDGTLPYYKDLVPSAEETPAS
ncbi:DNA modification methylase [Microbacterium sp. ARD32]|uniref:DNA modification methylase n=1 Tax=Microbacterium sp. ARD32 TaxID=2962577 RepID=UPI0028829CBA|nr:DNA modification methylase [Microbacterium sp. ARD32]MDT0158510.1 DNA modification methylase [Microbacterium sp. ARD32]